MNTDDRNSAKYGNPTGRSLTRDGAVMGIVLGSAVCILFSEIFMGIASLLEGRGFHPGEWWAYSTYMILGSIASGVAAGTGPALIGRRKTDLLEWTLTGLLGGVLGDLLTGPTWARADAQFYFSTDQIIGLMLTAAASTGVAAGLTAWWVNRLAGAEAPVTPITGRWFVAHIFSALSIALLLAWPLYMLSRIF